MDGVKFLALQVSDQMAAYSFGDNGNIIGALVPVAADGFYRLKSDAEGAAQFMAEEKQGCATYVVEVVSVIRFPHEAKNEAQA